MLQNESPLGIAVIVIVALVGCVVVVYAWVLSLKLMARFSAWTWKRKTPDQKARTQARMTARLAKISPPPGDEDAARAEVEAVFPGATEHDQGHDGSSGSQ
jgi:hypothetical protein